MENTKKDGNSSGLVAVAWLNTKYKTIYADGDAEDGDIPLSEAYKAGELTPLIRLSDAEAIIAEQAERIKELEADLSEEAHIRDRMAQLLAETAVAIKGPEKALHRHGWQDLPEVAAKQSAALKLARGVFRKITRRANHLDALDIAREANEAIAAIDEVLKGE